VPIVAVQGDSYRSPLTGQRVVVRGAVTRIEPGRGFYLEDRAGGGERAAQRASRAVFVADAETAAALTPGQVVQLAGNVAETGSGRDTLTALTTPADLQLCGASDDLPSTPITLPLDARAREALEGMRVALSQPFAVTDTYNLHRGELTLAADAPLRVPTEDATPGDAAREAARRNRQRELAVALPGSERPPLPIGARLSGLIGVMGHDGDEQRFYPERLPEAELGADRPIDPAATGRVRIVSLNLLNYFNGDGRGGGFPTERGARDPAGFHEQQQRLAAALAELRPQLLAVQELENDGFGEYSAAQSLLQLLRDRTGYDWAVVDPGNGPVGGDVITVGLFYRTAELEALGPPRVLGGPAFVRLSREPLAQLFRDRASGERLLVVANHLKSKGRCPDGGPNADRQDGQGCWNEARMDAVEAQLPWLQDLAVGAGTEHILILGDMNAWRREDPIRAFRAGGYVELVEKLAGPPQHSFLYFGQRGTLDYAFATPTLAALARAARIWHINSDWPRQLPLPQPWLRASDHDPVVIDFDFSQSATSD
jgi:predicted extracellular nuclease